MGFVLFGGDKGLLLLFSIVSAGRFDVLQDTSSALGEGTTLCFERTQCERTVRARVADDTDVAVGYLTESLVLSGLTVGESNGNDTNVGFILLWHGDGDYRIYRYYIEAIDTIDVIEACNWATLLRVYP